MRRYLAAGTGCDLGRCLVGGGGAVVALGCLAGRMQAGAFKGTGSGKAVLMLEYLAGGMERDLGRCLDGRIQAGAFRGTGSGRAVVMLERYLAG
jgi:hypothetical protein